MAAAWASRDTTRQAAANTGQNLSFSSLLGDDNFEPLQFNYILLFNASGGFVAGKGYSLETHREQPVPASHLFSNHLINYWNALPIP